MGRLTDLQLKNLKGKASESVGGRGDGTLLFRRRPSGSVEVYYRYRLSGQDSHIKLGAYKLTRDGHGYTLAECRDKAQELAKIRRECGCDLKDYLDAEQQRVEQQQQEDKRLHELEASRGTFADLMEAYLQDQKRQEKSSVKQTRQAFQRNVLNAYPHIASKKAKDVHPDDIVTILAAIHNRGAEAESVRVRSLLSACFNFGQNTDFDPTRVGEKRFYIEHNPVVATKKNTQAVKVGERVLSHGEVKQLWDEIVDIHRVGLITSAFIRFMIATGGQRPLQLVRARWEDYDFARSCVTLYSKKGKGGRKRTHVVPLTKRALAILDEVKAFSEEYPWPFCSGQPSRAEETKGQYVHLEIGSIKNAFKRYNEHLAEQACQRKISTPEWFSARDIRRTIKNILIDAGVNREQRNLLQCHAQTGVDIEHYDRHEHLPEKRESMRKYDALLDKILSGMDVNLIDLEEYRLSSLK